MLRVCFAFGVILLAAQGFAADGYVSLFNGKDLTGWTKRGGDATYSVDGDSIVGKRGPGPNTFLCTDKKFANFILKFEFKFDEHVNSGVQFRSNAKKDGDRETVFGYQCEMDADKMTGGVYDESRRNRWVDPLTEEVQERCKTAVKRDDWNKMTIQCVGPSIKTWLNGQPISDFIDTVDAEGFFGLQVHSAPGGQVRWKNIMVKELPETPWIQLFNDKELSNLEVKPAGKWIMNDEGIVHATSVAGESRDGLVLTKKPYSNFAGKVSFKQVKGNSGLYFAATENDRPYWVNGIQGEVDGMATGGIWYVTEGRWIVAPDTKREIIEKSFKNDAWNDFSVVGVGDRIVTNLNGNEISQVKNSKLSITGKLGLQLHGGADMEYYFKDFYVMPISDEVLGYITSTVEP